METTLYQGDCLDRMKEIADGSVDCILADLPFGRTRNRWDNVIPFEPLWEQYRRVIKHGGAILLFGQMPFSAALVMSNTKEFRYEWIWEKSCASGFLNAKKAPLKSHESILLFADKFPYYHPQFKKGEPYTRPRNHQSANYGKMSPNATISDGRRFPRDVLRFPNERGLHPTQKPVPLLEYLIRTYTNPGETVLDNVMGSGSCGVAAVNTGRNFIGIELDPGYFQIAQERIQATQEAAKCT